MKRTLFVGLLGFVIGAIAGGGVSGLLFRKSAEDHPETQKTTRPVQLEMGNIDLRLPESTVSKALETRVIELTVNENGELIVPDREPIRDEREIEVFLERQARSVKETDSREPIRVVVKFHPEVRYKEVFRITEACKKSKLRDIVVRMCQGK